MTKGVCFALLLASVLTLGAGETLYNGIALPDVWPPRSFVTLTREVQRVPYLENRPAVVPIDVGRQLFVDDFLIETRPLRFSGRHLFVNAALGKGSLRVEVTDEGGTVIPGYSKADCEPVTGDGVKVCVRWKSAGDLSPLVGKPVRFRFVLSDTELDSGDLYAYWVSPTLKGESRGYVGGVVK